MATSTRNFAIGEFTNNVSGPLACNAFSLATIAGDTIVVMIRSGGDSTRWNFYNGGITNITDTGTNTYNLKASHTTQGHDPNGWIYVAENVNGATGSNIVSVNTGTGGGDPDAGETWFTWVAIWELTGVPASSFDYADVEYNTGPTGNPSSSASFASGVGVTNCAVLGGFSIANFRTYTTQAPFTLTDGAIGNASGQDYGGLIEYHSTSGFSGSTYFNANTGSGSDPWEATFMKCIIKGTAGAGGRATKNTRAWGLGTDLGMNLWSEQCKHAPRIGAAA